MKNKIIILFTKVLNIFLSSSKVSYGCGAEISTFLSLNSPHFSIALNNFSPLKQLVDKKTSHLIVTSLRILLDFSDARISFIVSIPTSKFALVLFFLTQHFKKCLISSI